MARAISYSARTVKHVGTIDGHWVLVKMNNERVIADGNKFIVRIGDTNIPIFLHQPDEDGTPSWGLSYTNGEQHASKLEEFDPEYADDMVEFLNNYLYREGEYRLYGL